MSFIIKNQKPTRLNPEHSIPISGDYDLNKAFRETMVKPIFAPQPGMQVSITDAQGKNYGVDDITPIVFNSFDNDRNLAAEADTGELYRQTLQFYDSAKELLLNEVFVNQAATSNGLPSPTPYTLYTVNTDVIPSAKDLLVNKDQATADKFFASLAFTYQSPEILGFWFLGEAEYELFREWFMEQVQNLMNVIPQQTYNMLMKFHKIKLSTIAESFILRKQDSDQLDEFSFARIVVYLFMQYMVRGNVNNPAEQRFGVLPFMVSELFLPKNVVIVNTEMHAHSKPKDINNEWNLINHSLRNKLRVINYHNLTKLTSVSRRLQKAKQASYNQQGCQDAQRSSITVSLRKAPPKPIDLEKHIVTVLHRMEKVNHSQNVFKMAKSSFLKSNRRDPQDYNKPGKIISKKYLPDLHIYLDTSGSITEQNYHQGIMSIAKLAKRLNTNLYFNSFSHLLSKEAILVLSGKSLLQVWEQFQKIPKVTGGTDFSQIWDYINISKTRSRRMSIIITDFEWAADNSRRTHPENLFYAPISNTDWDKLTRDVAYFTKSAKHIKANLPKHCLGVYR